MKNRIKPDRKAYASNGTPVIIKSTGPEPAKTVEEEIAKAETQKVNVLKTDKTKAKTNE